MQVTMMMGLKRKDVAEKVKEGRMDELSAMFNMMVEQHRKAQGQPLLSTVSACRRNEKYKKNLPIENWTFKQSSIHKPPKRACKPSLLSMFTAETDLASHRGAT